MNNYKVSGKKLYKGKKYNVYSMDENRKRAIAESHRMLFLGNVNEKTFNFEKIRINNSYDKKSKKSDYHTLYLCRSDETDRMKKKRFFGKKMVRNSLKKETNKIIDEELDLLNDLNRNYDE